MTSTHTMGVGLAVAALLALVGCGGGSTKTVTADATDTSSTAAQPSNNGTAQLGQPITLKGSKPGHLAEYTAVRIIDPVNVGRDSQLRKGNRAVGVEFSITNRGEPGFLYEEGPANALTIIGDDGTVYPYLEVSAGPCISEGFVDQVVVRPGQTRRGCVPFQLPQDAKIAAIDFADNYGSGPGYAEWTVP